MGPEAGEVSPGPRRSGRVLVVARGTPGQPPPAPAPRHTEVQRGGAAQPHPGAGPGPAPARGLPLASPAPALPELGVQRLLLCVRVIQCLGLPALPATSRPTPCPISACTNPSKGPHFTEDAEAGGRGPLPPPSASRTQAGRRRLGFPRSRRPRLGLPTRQLARLAWPLSFSSCWLECGHSRARCPPPSRLVSALPVDELGRLQGAAGQKTREQLLLQSPSLPLSWPGFLGLSLSPLPGALNQASFPDLEFGCQA